MVMNKQKGNMYGFVTHTWNPIRGKCPHDCSYCYMKVFKNIGELRLDDKALKDDLGSGNFIFVGSSTDMFAKDVPYEWIKKVLDYCKKFDNKYLFQSKNPERFLEFVFPHNIILGTTVETNSVAEEWYDNISKAPNTAWRLSAMGKLPKEIKKMISIEPIMDFGDLMVDWIRDVEPEFVSIGADSKNHKLPEPSKEKINALIEKLKTFTEVKIKDNLRRLTG